MDAIEWTETAFCYDSGLAFINNVRVDFQSGHIPVDLIKKFVGTVATIKMKPDPGQELFAVEGNRAITNSNLYLQGPLLVDRGKVHELIESDAVVAIQSVDDFVVRRWFNDKFRRTYAKEAREPGATLERFHKLNQESIWLRDNAELRGSKPMLWVTTKKCVMDGGDSLAEIERIRALLGLLHYQGPQTLCVFSVPLAVVEGNLRRPNAFDGGINFIFKSNDNLAEPYGRAVDLETYHAGGIEMVTSPVSLHNATLLGWRKLNYSIRVDWERIHGRVDVSSLRAFWHEVTSL